MWRAERLKAGAGSRSQAAKPRPPPGSSYYMAMSAWWVGVAQRGVGGAHRLSVSPWERGGVNRCPRPSRQALPLTPAPPRVCMAFWLLHCASGSGQRSTSSSRLLLLLWPPHPPWCILFCQSRCRLCMCCYLAANTGSGAAVVAAWLLRCYAKSPPHPHPHPRLLPTDGACSSRPAALRLTLLLTLDLFLWRQHKQTKCDFWSCVFLSTSSSPPLIHLSFLSCFLVSPLCLPAGTQREKGGLGAVCLKPSRFNLPRPSTVAKKRLYVLRSFSDPLSREKWLPSLFLFFFLESRKRQKCRNCCSDVWVFFLELFSCFALVDGKRLGGWLVLTDGRRLAPPPVPTFPPRRSRQTFFCATALIFTGNKRRCMHKGCQPRPGRSSQARRRQRTEETQSAWSNQANQPTSVIRPEEGRLYSPNGLGQEAMSVIANRDWKLQAARQSAASLTACPSQGSLTHRSSLLHSSALIEYLWMPVLLQNGTSESTLKPFMYVVHPSPYCASTSTHHTYQRRVELVHVFHCSIGDLSAVRCRFLSLVFCCCFFGCDDGKDETQCLAPFTLFT